MTLLLAKFIHRPFHSIMVLFYILRFYGAQSSWLTILVIYVFDYYLYQ